MNNIKKQLELQSIPEKFFLLTVSYIFPFRTLPLTLWGNASSAFDAAINILNFYNSSKQLSKNTLPKDLYKFLLNQYTYYLKHSYGFISYWDDEYPEEWKYLHDPPLFVFYRGNVSLLKSKKWGIVGTRLPSPVSVHFCRHFIKKNKNLDISIVSGFAGGIDKIAHSTALDYSIPTIAILGNGLNKVYPSENISLAKKIKNSGEEQTLVLSEFPFFTSPLAMNFPRRNRLIASLCEKLIIMESPHGGGSLITLDYVRGQNCEPCIFYHPLQSNNDGGYFTIKKNEAYYVNPDTENFYTFHFDSIRKHSKLKVFCKIKALLALFIKNKKALAIGRDVYAFCSFTYLKQFLKELKYLKNEKISFPKN